MRPSKFLRLLAVAPAMAIVSVGHAQAPESTVEKEIRIVRTDTPPVIDGRLDDAVWSTAAVIDDFVVSQPNEGDEPTEYTQVYLLYDSEALYVAMRAWMSTPGNVTAQVLRQGESIFADDDFAIILDPFNNQRSGYFFAINPNGVREDALYENTTSMEFNWDGIFFAATTQDEDGWTAEVSLPFKTLSFDPENDTWGQ